MYACLLKVVLGPDTRETAQRLADFFDPLMRELPGFQTNFFGANYEAGEYCSFSLWDTREHLIAALRVTYPLSQKLMSFEYQWAPSYEIFEIYDPSLKNGVGG
ncbi:hypothetical protein [Alicyclobacillus mengziensis]|uniref:ABM domain-containing protein n=1 Tax=Alicyclobacillus mengziensis TaxID=2931921 RepID=A0A9X7VZE2_9BACL|nr:hypothetical protein [Alicyclobacillus mengziensis]QSO46523.1 hypothetical protein JZ786_18955 [Alicyclobacillus mengziensis]